MDHARAEAALASDAIIAVGKINGHALACGYREIAQRARALIIERAAQTREVGELFEQATNDAFLASGKVPMNGGSPEGCPAPAALFATLDAIAPSSKTPARPSHTFELGEASNTTNTAHATDTVSAPETGINPRYLLQAANGRAIMDSDFPERFQLITFGYTSCPDVCPSTLLEMADILKQLGDDAQRVQAIFISLDPERDTLAHLRTYTGFFDSRIMGATGSPDLLKHAAQSFKVYYKKVSEPNASPDHYAIDHTVGMYLLAPGGQFMTRFAYNKPVDEILAVLREEISKRAKRADAS